MITDAIINALLFLPTLLLQGLDNLNFSFELPSGIYTTLYNISKGVGYVLPLPFLISISVIKIGIHSFRLVWSIILRIKSFIPTMGV